MVVLRVDLKVVQMVYKKDSSRAPKKVDELVLMRDDLLEKYWVVSMALKLVQAWVDMTEY